MGMVEVAVTIVCGVEGQSFSNKMTLITPERNEGKNHAANLIKKKKKSPSREKTEYTGIGGRSILGLFI